MRTKLVDRILPDYTRGEELFNMISHIVGGAMGITVLVLCTIKSVLNGSGYDIAGSVVYGVTMILLYTMSSIYHGLTNEMAKKVFQVLDHCTIYFLIAGTYTPIALSGLMRIDPALAWTIFAVEWGCAAVAVSLTAIDIKKFQTFSMVCNIVMGWCVVAFVSKAVEALTMNGFLLLLAGGIFYTIGAVLYGIGKKKRYMHNVFHVFVLLGSFFQFISIYFYVL